MNQQLTAHGVGLIILVGPSGAGKSSWLAANAQPEEIVSTDGIREELTGDFRDQSMNNQVFSLFHQRIHDRLQAGHRVYADATHLRTRDRLTTAQIGFDLNVPVTYLVINRPLEEKLITAGWREQVVINGKSLVELHDETFRSNEKAILTGDGKNVLVIDTRI